MSKFKVGDRVTMNVSASRYTGESGIVVRVVKNENSVDNLVVQFDCNEPGHVVSYSDSYFKYAPVEQKDLAKKYAVWFSHTYTHIAMAGGDPITVLDRIGYETIDTLVRNNLYIMYKGNE